MIFQTEAESYLIKLQHPLSLQEVSTTAFFTVTLSGLQKGLQLLSGH